MSPLDTTILNYYEKVEKPTPIGTYTLRDWLALLSKSTSTKLILDARKGKVDYNQTKRSIPVVTYNFLFKDRKLDVNILHSTGVMYFDLDTPEFDISKLDLSKVFVLYHSFGGRSYSMLVRVEGVTFDNFEDSYYSIAKDLGIDYLYDTNAAKPTQYAALSYDPNPYINEDCLIFDVKNNPSSVILPDKKSSKKKVSKITPVQLVKEEKGRYITEVGLKIPYTQLHFNNLRDYEFTCDYIVNWSGFTYIHCYIPFRNKCTNKYNTLMSYCTNLVWLNPGISYKRTLDIIHRVNAIFYNQPSVSANVKRIVDTVHKQNAEGILYPIHDKHRYIIFDHDNKSKLTKEDKLEICRDELSKKRVLESKRKIGQLIDEWEPLLDGKISIKSLSRKGKMSTNTIDKYYKLFKDVIAIKNNKKGGN